MILLDSDHLSVLWYVDSVSGVQLRGRLDGTPSEAVALPVIVLEEQLRGWLGAIGRAGDLDKQIMAYDKLIRALEFLSRWPNVRFDERSAQEFRRLRRAKVRIGTQDLKIAAIALANNALLLTANARDFRKVPGLRFDNWLTP